MSYPTTLTIAMHGKKQAGKSTSARYILKQLEDELYPKFGVDIQCRIFSFATIMKDILCKLFGIQPSMLYGSDVCKNSTALTVPVVNAKEFNFASDNEYVTENQLGAFLNIDPEKVFHDVNRNENLYPVSHRQLMQLFGKMMRAIDPNCFINATMKEVDDFFLSESSARLKVAIIDDCRMDNEAKEILLRGGHVIHLTRSPHEDGDVSEQASWIGLEILEQGLAIRNTISKENIKSVGRNPLYDGYPPPVVKNIHKVDNEQMHIEQRNNAIRTIIQQITYTL